MALQTFEKTLPDFIGDDRPQNTNKFEVFYPSNSGRYDNVTTMINQDKDVPIANTRASKHRKLLCTTEIICSCPSASEA